MDNQSYKDIEKGGDLMSDRIMEDSQSIKNIGDNIIEEDIKNFDLLTKELFEELNREIGLDPSHQTWYGPNAELFMNNINLKEQGEAWEKFEKN